MKKIFVLFVSLFFFATISAQIPPGYYDPAAGLTGLPLKIALHDIIKNHTVISYSNLYSQFQITDTKGSNEVWDMYSDIPGGTPHYIYHYVSTDECGNYSTEGDCFNREHAFPQSLFGSTGSIYSDIFQLYPTDGYVNNRRSNYPMGDVSSPTWTSFNGSKVGPCSFIAPSGSYTGTVFEPIDEYKGDFARTYFYIAVRYYTEDAGWTSNGMNTGAEPQLWALAQYLQWSHNDTVSQKEIDRNNATYLIQNNRNPFIDHPEWADSIWGALITRISENTSNESVSIFPNPSEGDFTLSISSHEKKSITAQLYSIDGMKVYSSSISGNGNIMKTKIDLHGLAKGIYFLKIITEKNVISKQIIIQ